MSKKVVLLKDSQKDVQKGSYEVWSKKNVATTRKIQNILKIDYWKFWKIYKYQEWKVRNLATYENEYSEPCTRILTYIF